MDSQEILTFVVWNAKFMNYLTLLWPKETTNADRPAMWQPYYAETTQTKHPLGWLFYILMKEMNNLDCGTLYNDQLWLSKHK